MTDMPQLNDARRCARIIMVLDEILNAKDLNSTSTISAYEFKMCGGTPNDPHKKYSLYRQIIYSIRDLKAYIRRGMCPSCDALQKAKRWYLFHEKIAIKKECEDDAMKTKTFNRIIRFLLILQKIRRNINRKSSPRDIKNLVKTLSFSYDEFLLCGGKIIRGKRKNEAVSFPLELQLNYAVQDLKQILDKRKMYPPCVVQKARKYINIHNPNIISETSDEEDVDDIDGGLPSRFYLDDNFEHKKILDCKINNDKDDCDDDKHDTDEDKYENGIIENSDDNEENLDDNEENSDDNEENSDDNEENSDYDGNNSDHN